MEIRSWFLSAEITLRDLLEVQAYFGLPSPALVEKDFHVVKALAAIAAVNTAPLGLVFGGGTALARAHRLIRRMSEDIDLKVIAEKEPSRGELRRLRELITAALRAARSRGGGATPRNQNRSCRLAAVAARGSVARRLVCLGNSSAAGGSSKHQLCFDHTNRGGKIRRADAQDGSRAGRSCRAARSHAGASYV